MGLKYHDWKMPMAVGSYASENCSFLTYMQEQVPFTSGKLFIIIFLEILVYFYFLTLT